MRPPLTECPERPVGAKLEITYACNLRCGFCYTDSPRHTLQRTPELSDDEWREVVRQSLDLGIVEAVVTGGEPLLRRELTLELIETMAGAGVGVTLNTNGWFVDEEVASRLGALSGVTAHVSVDGAQPSVHDTSRGVPGSWRRAIEGIDRLLAHGVGVCGVHVVTPANVDTLPELLEQMWMLGMPWVRLTPVIVTGAAARGGRWKVSAQALTRAADDFETRHGNAMRISVQPATVTSLGLQGQIAPGSFLVRPNGDLRPDSLRPFSFGNVVEDGVASRWQALREGWDDERIVRWARGMGDAGDLPKAEVVPYLDEEVSLVSGAREEGAGGRDAPVPEKTPPKPGDSTVELREAEAMVRELAGRRRYRHAPLRWTGSPGQRFVRLVGDGRYLRLNESGGVVMDALDGGTLADAESALRARYGIDAARARDDALAATRDLLGRQVVMAADASGHHPAEPGTTDLPGSEPDG